MNHLVRTRREREREKPHGEKYIIIGQREKKSATTRKKPINISMMVNECSNEQMTRSSAMRWQAISQHQFYQPLNYLLCLKFRAMIKFQRAIAWKSEHRSSRSFRGSSEVLRLICSTLPSSVSFLSLVSKMNAMTMTMSMRATARTIEEKQKKNNGSKFLKRTPPIKDNVRCDVGILIRVLYLHKSVHTLYLPTDESPCV